MTKSITLADGYRFEIDFKVTVTPPAVPTVGIASPNNDNTPVITGAATLNPDDLLTVTINAITYTDGDGDLHSDNDGTWTLTIPPANALPDGTYDVVAAVTNTAGTATDTTTDEVTIDTVPPPIPTVDALNTASATPTLTGTAIVGANDAVFVDLNGVQYGPSGVDFVLNGDDTWTLNIPPGNALQDGTYTVVVGIIDEAGNSSLSTSSDQLNIMEVAGSTIPTVDAQISATSTPTLTGTVTIPPGDSFSVGLHVTIYELGTDPELTLSGNVWTLNIPPEDAIPDGTYSVWAVIYHAGGGSTIDGTDNELTIGVPTVPAIPTVNAQNTTGFTPTITGTAVLAAGDTLTVEVDGTVYSEGADLVITGNTWALTIPVTNALAVGIYDVIATATNAQGPSTDTTNNELAVSSVTGGGMLAALSNEFEGAGSAVKQEKSQVYFVENGNEFGAGSLPATPQDSHVLLPYLHEDIVFPNGWVDRTPDTWLHGKTSRYGQLIRGTSLVAHPAALYQISASDKIVTDVTVISGEMSGNNDSHSGLDIVGQNGDVVRRVVFKNISALGGADNAGQVYGAPNSNGLVDGVSVIDSIYAMSLNGDNPGAGLNGAGDGGSQPQYASINQHVSNLSFIRTLFQGDSRCPVTDRCDWIDQANCISLGGSTFLYLRVSSIFGASMRVNLQKNLKIITPGGQSQYPHLWQETASGLSIHMDDNRTMSGSDPSTAVAAVVGSASTGAPSNTWSGIPRHNEMPAYPLMDHIELHAYIAANAGASHNRSPYDDTVISHMLAGTRIPDRYNISDFGYTGTSSNYADMQGRSGLAVFPEIFDKDQPDGIKTTVKESHGFSASANLLQLPNHAGGTSTAFLAMLDHYGML